MIQQPLPVTDSASNLLGCGIAAWGGQELDAEILGWYDLGVRLALPRVAVPAPTEADVIVIRGDGETANPLKVTLAP